MLNEKEQREFKLFKQLIPDADLTSFRKFKTCVETKAVQQSSIPVSVISAAMTYWCIPKRFESFRNIMTVLAGMSTYVLGNISFKMKCMEETFGKDKLSEIRSRRRAEYKYNEEEQQGKLYVSSNNLEEEELIWDNSVNKFESSSNEFKDVSDNLEEQLINEQQENKKKRVTYDDLWMKHRKQEGEYDNAYRNYLPRTRILPESAEKSAEKPAEKSATFEELEDISEKDTWN